VRTEKRNFQYDYLVVALGVKYSFSAIPGLGEGTHAFYILDGPYRLYRAIQEFKGGKIAICIADLPYKCPPAPYEGGLLLDSFLFRREIKDVELTIFTPEEYPLLIIGSSVSGTIVRLLESRNIRFFGNKKLSSVESSGRVLHFSDGSTYKYTLCITVPPHRLSVVVRDCSLIGEGGWIDVDPRTLQTSHEKVFAIGDTTSLPIGEKKYLLKTGIFAFHEAEIVANNIAADILGNQGNKEFAGTGHCFLETGYGKASYIQANYFDPSSSWAATQEPSVKHHWAKVMFEKYWLWRWF
jgi:sulfide:quinone oxidoreductase